jgi:Tfp pilus assembly protein PilX
MIEMLKRNKTKHKGFALLLDVVFIMTMTALMLAAVTVVILHTKVTSDATSYDDSVIAARSGIQSSITLFNSTAVLNKDAGADSNWKMTDIPCNAAGYLDASGNGTTIPGTNGLTNSAWFSQITMYTDDPTDSTKTVKASTCDATRDTITDDSSFVAKYAVITSVGKAEDGTSTTLVGLYRLKTASQQSSLTYINSKYATTPFKTD